MKFAALVAAVVVGWAVSVQAGPLRFEDVSADARWLVHVDGDGMRASSVVQNFFSACVKCESPIERVFRRIERRFGLDVRKDLHSVTAWGLRFPPNPAVLIIRAKWHKESLIEKAQQARDMKTVTHRDYQIYTWTERMGGQPRTPAATLYRPDTLVVAGSADAAKEALDVLDGKTANLTGRKGTPLAAAVPEGALVVARAVDVQKAMASNRLPLLKLVQEFDYAKGQHDGQWFGALNVTTESPEVATQMQQVLQGFVALTSLRAHEHAGLVKLLGNFQVKTDGNHLHASIHVPADAVIAELPELCTLMHEHLRRMMWIRRHHPWHRGWRHHSYDAREHDGAGQELEKGPRELPHAH